MYKDNFCEIISKFNLAHNHNHPSACLISLRTSDDATRSVHLQKSAALIIRVSVHTSLCYPSKTPPK